VAGELEVSFYDFKPWRLDSFLKKGS
jgi:hypothetical protein